MTLRLLTVKSNPSGGEEPPCVPLDSPPFRRARISRNSDHAKQVVVCHSTHTPARKSPLQLGGVKEERMHQKEEREPAEGRR